MKEPKTLKDIPTCPDCKSIEPCKDTEIIRKEAEQWIKYLSQPESPEENIWIADWIKMFFNLEEQ